MTAREPAAFTLAAGSPPSAQALDDDIYLTLPLAAPPGGEPANVDVFLTVDFARRAIAALERAVGEATRSRP